MPITMTIADKAMIVRSIVNHDGVCVEGCSSIALRLFPKRIITVGSAGEREIDRTRSGIFTDPIAQRDLIREEPPPIRHRRR